MKEKSLSPNAAFQQPPSVHENILIQQPDEKSEDNLVLPHQSPRSRILRFIDRAGNKARVYCDDYRQLPEERKERICAGTSVKIPRSGK